MPTPPPLKSSMPVYVRALFWFAIAAAVVVVALVASRVTGRFQAYRVPTNGMAPTLCNGDLIYVEGVSFFFTRPKRGEVVIFDTTGIDGIAARSSAAGPMKFIQRIAAIPGDVVGLENGALTINGKPAPELEGRRYTDYQEVLTKGVTVPVGSYLTLGDNSENSMDGRYWGFVPEKNIVGRYLCHYWRAADRSGLRAPPR